MESRVKEKDSKSTSSSHFYPKTGDLKAPKSPKKRNVLDNMHLKADQYDTDKLSINKNVSTMNELFNKKYVGGLVLEDNVPILDNEDFTSRPVCRKKEPTEQLEDLDYSVEKRVIQKRPISTPNLMRPPSRHKTPPKALGLDIPLDGVTLDKLKLDSLAKKRPNTSKPSLKPVSNGNVDNIMFMVCKTEEEDIMVGLSPNTLTHGSSKVPCSPLFPLKNDSVHSVKKCSNTK